MDNSSEVFKETSRNVHVTIDKWSFHHNKANSKIIKDWWNEVRVQA
jgi:hypothetical protein